MSLWQGKRQFNVLLSAICFFVLSAGFTAGAQAINSSNVSPGKIQVSPALESAAASSNLDQSISAGSNSAAPESIHLSSDTNFPSGVIPDTSGTNVTQASLEMATYFINTRQPKNAERLLVKLLSPDVPESVQKTALLKLAKAVHDENDLPRAQSIYAQYLEHWPGDLKIPEVLLCQGQIFRQMGLNDLALGKFYAVMAAALSLKNSQFNYYQSLVLQAQIQIADTHYLMGQFSDAADFYLRLLKNPSAALDRQKTQFRLVRSLALIKRNDQAVAQAKDFIARFPEAEQVPEVRYYLATALKDLGQNNEAMQQTLLCLREQKGETKHNPDAWNYWRQRIGNDIANQLYHDGDYLKALEIYVSLAHLDSSPNWQIPVNYQMGLTYEKLLQPQKAIQTYDAILARQNEVGTNMTPALQTVFDMARWRAGFVRWQTNADAVDHSMSTLLSATAGLTNSPTHAEP